MRVLLSVYDKTGLIDLGRGLVARGFELVSTGGTARALAEAGLPVTSVSDVTGFPEAANERRGVGIGIVPIARYDHWTCDPQLP